MQDFLNQIYLYGYVYVLATAMDGRNIFHKMDTCILGYEFECASNRRASRRKFSHNEDISAPSCPPETCKTKHQSTQCPFLCLRQATDRREKSANVCVCAGYDQGSNWHSGFLELETALFSIYGPKAYILPMRRNNMLRRGPC